MSEKIYSTAGPFIVECEGNPFIGVYRCWLASDPEKKVLCEGSARDLGNYFEAVCSTPNPSTGPARTWTCESCGMRGRPADAVECANCGAKRPDQL